MKFALWSLVAAASAPLFASAAPPFLFQGAQRGAAAQVSFESPEPAAAAHRVQDLSVDDFQAVQHAIKDSFEHAVDNAKHLIQDTFGLVDDEVDADEFPRPHFPSHPLPPPVIDLKEYTIYEIVNASLEHHHHHHRRCGHSEDADLADAEEAERHLNDESGRKIRKGLAAAFFSHAYGEDEGEHKPDPSRLPFHRLAWLANFSTEAGDLLKQKGPITLLAPDDAALTPPHREHHGEHFGPPGRRSKGPRGDHDRPAPRHAEEGEHDPLRGAFSEAAPHPFHSKAFSPESLAALASDNGDDDEDKERRREIFKKLIAIVAKYHIIPEAAEAQDLVDRATLPTLLTDERVRVSPSFSGFPFPHPTLKFNVYAEKRGPTILAKNGVIHLISAPLLPPFTPLNQAFLTPQYFAALTNAVQKAGLAPALVPQHSYDAESEIDAEVPPLVSELIQELVAEKGLNEYTLFAPSNWAFGRLPYPILAFLHSPFPISQKVLKYLLAYHVVPGVTFYSDFYKNNSSIAGAALSVREEVDVEIAIDLPLEGPHPPPPPHWPGHEPSQRGNITHYVLPTLLTESNKNATLRVDVISYRFAGKGPIRRSIVVLPAHHPHHHHDEHDKERFGGGPRDGPLHPHPVKVAFNDVPARKGAIQVLGRDLLLPPPPPHHDESGLSGMNAFEAKQIRKALRQMRI
ncbi:hypothetical protein JCM10908_000556 [Rhodotorula pacifica]|uniref:fasciclin domain-containing protein n=1 Tax=Rhodotorula pacifica TaxID=1495444 RepID=UPI003173CBF8